MRFVDLPNWLVLMRGGGGGGGEFLGAVLELSSPRKYPDPSHGFFGLHSPIPLEIPVKLYTFLYKFLLLRTPTLLKISNDLSSMG